MNRALEYRDKTSPEALALSVKQSSLDSSTKGRSEMSEEYIYGIIVLAIVVVVGAGIMLYVLMGVL